MARPLEGRLGSGLKRVGLRLSMASAVTDGWPQKGRIQALGRYGKYLRSAETLLSAA